jgi:hypothetical protein
MTSIKEINGLNLLHTVVGASRDLNQYEDMLINKELVNIEIVDWNKALVDMILEIDNCTTIFGFNTIVLKCSNLVNSLKLNTLADMLYLCIQANNLFSILETKKIKIKRIINV